MLRRLAFLLIAVSAGLSSAADPRDPIPGTRFLSPQNGSQAIGVWPLEVTTTVTGVDRVDFFIDGTLAGVARKPPYRVMHDFGTSLVPHEIEAKVFSNGYRTADSAKVLTAGAGANESVNVDLVEVALRAQSPQALTARDLKLRENGVEQTIRDVLPQRGAARFVFVVDRSLSMGDGKLAAALHAIDGVWHYLRPGDRVEAVLFNHNVGKLQEVARGAALSQSLGEVAPSGGTSLRDAVSSIASRERTYAIVLTDGGDRNSAIAEEAALERISGTKTVLDAIVLGGRSDFLEDAARNTGGNVVHANASTLEEKLRELLLDINSRYLVVYQSHGNGPGWRSITITTAARGVRIVNARKGYFAR